MRRVGPELLTFFGSISVAAVGRAIEANGVRNKTSHVCSFFLLKKKEKKKNSVLLACSA
jgi:hypothetical protein